MKETARRNLARVWAGGGGGGGLGIKFTQVEGPTMVGSDVKKFSKLYLLKG